MRISNDQNFIIRTPETVGFTIGVSVVRPPTYIVSSAAPTESAFDAAFETSFF